MVKLSARAAASNARSQVSVGKPTVERRSVITYP
jgi:hypothetical protein